MCMMTNILVKKVPDRVSHEDDFQVGMVALDWVVVHLKKISAHAIERARSAHLHVHFVADDTEFRGIKLL